MSHTESDMDILSHIRDLEESLWSRQTRYDGAWMDGILADDFVEFGRSGTIYRRSEMFFGPSASRDIPAEIPLPDLDLSVIGKDVVLVTYTSRLHEQSGVQSANRSSIWVKAQDGWKLRFHQGTAIQPR